MLQHTKHKEFVTEFKSTWQYRIQFPVPALAHPSYRRNSLISGAFVACFVIFLTSCGGGGSGSKSIPPISIHDLEPVNPSRRTTDEGLTSDSTRSAAMAETRSGSVTQSSRVDGSGKTLDQFELEIRDDGLGGKHLVATLTRNDAKNSVLTTNAVPGVIDVRTPSGKIYLSVTANADGGVSDDWINDHFTKEDWKKAEEREYHYLRAQGFENMYGAYPIPDTTPLDTENRPARTEYYPQDLFRPKEDDSRYLERSTDDKKLHNFFYSDISDNSINANGDNGILLSFLGNTDLEYISWGYWYYGAVKFQNLEAVLGGFADGPNVVAPLSLPGSASYLGYTHGFGMRNSESRTNLRYPEFIDFNANVNLSVNFGTQSVEGRIDGFKQLDGSDEHLDVFGNNGGLRDLVVNLGATQFSASDGVFESGSTTSNKDASGKWGGQFFGNPVIPNTAPPAAGGTWGISQGTEDEDWNLIGGFGTWLDSN